MWASDEYLQHFGILGQKWGVRRYQNEDGTLTEEGKTHYKKELDDRVDKDWWRAHNNAAQRTTDEYAKINSKKEYQNLDLDHPTKIEIKYIDEINKTWKRLYKEELDKFFGDNPVWNDYPLEALPMYTQFDEWLAEIEQNHK